MVVYKFSDSATEEPVLQLKNETEIKSFLYSKFNMKFQFGIDNLLNTGCYLLMGWKYVFNKELRTFLVKQHGRWTEYHAPNKTLLRKQIYGRIDKIVDVK